MKRLPVLAAMGGAWAAALPAAALAQPAPSMSDGIAGYFDHWFDRVNEAQETQPRWMTPLVTVTPRLEEEVRYDQFWQHLGNGGSLQNYDGGKGLELIPTTTNEVILNLPPFEERQVGRTRASGWADWPFLLVKQRLLSADEQNGNYCPASLTMTGFFESMARWLGGG